MVETLHTIIRQTAEEFNKRANKHLPRPVDLSEYPASIDYKTGSIYINIGVVPEELESFIAIHEQTEILNRERKDRFEIKAHREAIHAEYQAAQKSGKLREQHQLMSGLVKIEITKCRDNNWPRFEREMEEELAYREQVFRQLSS